MATLSHTQTESGGNAAAAIGEIRAAITGEVRTDRLSRALYATDGSIYEIFPDCLVLPRTAEDVAATVRICSKHRVPLTARGAGTGLTGGAVNGGVQLDCSRWLNRIVGIDPQARTATVEAGVVLDELNDQLKPHGLYFAPDPATSSRATVGGTVSNNASGSHSIVIGRTNDHVQSLDVVLSDGSMHTWGETARHTDNPLAKQCEDVLSAVAGECADEIARRYPNILRKNGGYALDRLTADSGRVNVEQVICGSEGTLAVVVRATLKLLPLPKHKTLVVVHFDELMDALGSVPPLLEHKPAAVELVDKFILDAARANPIMAKRGRFLQGDPAAILAAELYDEDEGMLEHRVQGLLDDLKAKSIGYAASVLREAARQADVWEMRKAGLGLLMSKPGDNQPIPFVEDASVPPSRLREYIERQQRIFHEEGCEQAGYYAHASVGLLHVRPVLNMKMAEDVQRMKRIGDRVSSLVVEFGGAMTGEHGDGIIRSSWLEKQYGPKIIEAFRRIKQTFDPHGILNPGKIVDPLPMTENLRFGPDFRTEEPRMMLDFTAYGGMAGLAAMCTGVGQCRQRLVGTMCPSYQATGDETDTTRARANALRLALSNRDILDGLSAPELERVFDLCISCKACKTECPTGTDVARLKTEWLAYRNRHFGVPARSRMIGRSVELAWWGSAFAPLSNWIAQAAPVRAWLERRYGIDRRVPPPKFVRRTFRKWYARHRKNRDAGADKPKVVYFVDSWANYYQPDVGIAAVKVLEALGYHVIAPPTKCCGRPLISKGLLPEAKLLAEQNVEVLSPFADRRIPIVGTEPSCVSVLQDEMPQLVRDLDSRRIADLSMNIETFVARELERRPDALRFRTDRPAVVYHGHCHQKALVGTDDAMAVLNASAANAASEINSGCCGMAGSFGHEVEHYEVSRAIGEQRLFPAIRDRGDAEVVVSGFSCRHQIEHHTGVHPKHVVEYLAEALDG